MSEATSDCAALAARHVLFVRLPPFLGFKSHHPRDVTLPLTIAHAATMVQHSGRRASILDVWSGRQTMEEVLQRIHAADPDVVFFEADAGPLPAIMRCAEAVRERSSAFLAAFGSVPTFLPQRLVGPGLPFDVALSGECEMTAMDLLDALEQGRPLAAVAGLSYWDRDENRLCRSPERALVKDLDEFPLVDYDLFRLDDYCKFSFPMPLHRRVRWGHVLATRGCPYPCTHCSFDHRQSFGQRFRKHSPRRVVDNLERLVKRHGVNAISFEDDIFTIDRKFALAVCDEIEARGLDVKWIIQTRVDCIDGELLRRMKRAGCVGVSLGIESGNDRVLSTLKKGFTREQALAGIRACQDEGLMLRLLFMIGNPSETTAEIEDSIDLAMQAKAITIQVHISTPYPGTRLLEGAEDDGQYIEDFSSYNTIVQNLSVVPDEELWKLQKKFYRKYFFSWRYMKVLGRQRLWYIAGSWRRDVPLLARALKYLVVPQPKPVERDVASAFAKASRAGAAIDRPQAHPAAGAGAIARGRPNRSIPAVTAQSLPSARRADEAAIADAGG